VLKTLFTRATTTATATTTTLSQKCYQKSEINFFRQSFLSKMRLDVDENVTEEEK
jgi:hypothetical protein